MLQVNTASGSSSSRLPNRASQPQNQGVFEFFITLMLREKNKRRWFLACWLANKPDASTLLRLLRNSMPLPAATPGHRVMQYTFESRAGTAKL